MLLHQLWHSIIIKYRTAVQCTTITLRSGQCLRRHLATQTIHVQAYTIFKPSFKNFSNKELKLCVDFLLSIKLWSFSYFYGFNKLWFCHELAFLQMGDGEFLRWSHQFANLDYCQTTSTWYGLALGRLRKDKFVKSI